MCVLAHGDSGGDFGGNLGGLGHFGGAGGGVASLSLEGESHGSSLSFDNGPGLSGGLSLEGGHEGGGSSYSGPSSYEVSDHGSSGGLQAHGGNSGGLGNSNGGDFHHGVSIVGAGGGDGHQDVSFDLTHHGGGGHSGPFGGSFVASAKYEGHGGVAHKVADGNHADYITFDHGQYSDVLRASQDGASGGDGGGYKWGFVPEVSEEQHS